MKEGNKLNKEVVKKLMKLKGETRGFNILPDRKWILKNKGEEGLEKVEKEAAKAGYPLHYDDLKVMSFYPAGLRAISLLSIKKAFDLDNEGIRGVCEFHLKQNLITKLFTKYFYSIPSTLKNAPKMWERHWTKGKFIVEEYDEEEKRVVIKIKDFEVHPVFCRCLEGYFAALANLVVGGNEAVCREKKCTFDEDNLHEYVIDF